MSGRNVLRPSHPRIAEMRQRNLWGKMQDEKLEMSGVVRAVNRAAISQEGAAKQPATGILPVILLGIS
jgi:hypothetical protein